MGGMEFTWRMVSALAWPAVAIVGVLAFRGWITDKLASFGISFGSFRVQLRTLDNKVDKVGQDISITLSDNMPRPAADEEIPRSLVDLISSVNRNRMGGIHAAFDIVQRALRKYYPQLNRVLPSQLPEVMRSLVDKGEMEPDVAMSVQQLYELLVMPELEKDPAGDTRGYAFLMLAEGAIHGILRSAEARGVGPGQDQPANARAPIRAPELSGTSWQGTYKKNNTVFPVRLDIKVQFLPHFSGTMTYPDDDTVTGIQGEVEDNADDVKLTWKETVYERTGRRTVDFNGSYSGTIKDGVMDCAWYQGGRRVASFEMTPSDKSATVAFSG